MIVKHELTVRGQVEEQEIRAFLALAEERHFGRAAQRLHVSTARVSQLIKKLERRIGVSLFERTSRKVVLTPVGQQLDDDLRYANPACLPGRS
jgi:DNA-binding transcriptional LysR family regulator